MNAARSPWDYFGFHRPGCIHRGEAWDEAVGPHQSYHWRHKEGAKLASWYRYSAWKLFHEFAFPWDPQLSDGSEAWSPRGNKLSLDLQASPYLLITDMAPFRLRADKSWHRNCSESTYGVWTIYFGAHSQAWTSFWCWSMALVWFECSAPCRGRRGWQRGRKALSFSREATEPSTKPLPPGGSDKWNNSTATARYG